MQASAEYTGGTASERHACDCDQSGAEEFRRICKLGGRTEGFGSEISCLADEARLDFLIGWDSLNSLPRAAWVGQRDACSYLTDTAIESASSMSMQLYWQT